MTKKASQDAQGNLTNSEVINSTQPTAEALSDMSNRSKSWREQRRASLMELSGMDMRDQTTQINLVKGAVEDITWIFAYLDELTQRLSQRLAETQKPPKTKGER